MGEWGNGGKRGRSVTIMPDVRAGPARISPQNAAHSLRLSPEQRTT